METADFNDFAKSMVDYIADYLENIRERRVTHSVEPGFLAPQLPAEAPAEPDSWRTLMADLESIIMPGITHWHSPRFHAYFPSANSYPAIVADLLSGAIGCVGFNYMASPACTELEQITTDWLGKAIGLPAEFLNGSGGCGGGVIQSTTSESTLLCLLAAKGQACDLAKQQRPELTEAQTIAKLVAYTSENAHSSVERAGMMAGVTIRLLGCDEHLSLRGDTLREAIRQDREAGLIPFFVVATLGTTNTCAFDNLDEIGQVTEAEGLWLHVDAAYAGAAFLCPEFRYLMKGVHRVRSFCMNPHKWMLVNFDCATMWIKDPEAITERFRVDDVRYQDGSCSLAPEYWAYIRGHVALAKEFELLVRQDDRFEIVGDVICGLVCVRLKGPNALTEELLRRINAHGVIHLVPGGVKGQFFMRFAVCSRYTHSGDIRISWAEIQKQADGLCSDPKADSRAIAGGRHIGAR